ncbi:unnamed protein product [Litomosoides sigmodontis]|uniref:Uncharacterized protein n=1 Tax=Litomosoides sigmodontis TaxID=42156 RepID=A0A3P7K5X0_LITSI|nr:unnamed protein product [Litomosoides sigmodontis]
MKGYSRNLTSIGDALALGRYFTVECLQNGLKITVKLSDLQRQIKIDEPIKLVLSDLKGGKRCETELHRNSRSKSISMLLPDTCLTNDTTHQILLVTGNQIIHKFEFSCDQMSTDVALSANINGETVAMNSSVQIGFDLTLVISSKHLPFHIVDCWMEQNNHRANFLQNGIPSRDSQSVPLCQLIDEADKFEFKYANDSSDRQPFAYNKMRKMREIRLRLSWDALPDSRQKALQQLLRTKPQLQWEAVPDLSLNMDDFLSPITIYPIMIHCTIAPLSPTRTSIIASFGPIGVFIPQFYFLEDALFSCCPIEATIAYANLLQRSKQKKLFCSKVSIATAFYVSLTAFTIAVCCTAIAFTVRYKNCR